MRKKYQCKDCKWEGYQKFKDFSQYREFYKADLISCPVCQSHNLQELAEFGRLGTKIHVQLIKKALLRVIDRYYIKHSQIKIENEKLGLNVGYEGLYARRDFWPDIYIEVREQAKTDYGSTSSANKIIVVECETTTNNLLRDEQRLVAYRLLKLQNPKMMLYLVVPEELRGKFEKPDFFNDVWYFDVNAGGENASEDRVQQDGEQ